MNNTLQKTKNYEQFKFLEGNRAINANHLFQLTKSILKNNLLSVNPILVNEDMHVIDGQHRLEVAKANDLDIYYIILTGATIEQVIELNATVRPWTVRDFILSYANRGNKAYQWLQGFMREYSLTVTQCMVLIYGSASYKDEAISRGILRTGRFDPSESQKETAARRADVVFELRPFINIKGLWPLSILRAIIALDSEDKLVPFVKQLRKRSVMITPRGEMREDEAQFRDILEGK